MPTSEGRKGELFAYIDCRRKGRGKISRRGCCSRFELLASHPRKSEGATRRRSCDASFHEARGVRRRSSYSAKSGARLISRI